MTITLEEAQAFLVHESYLLDDWKTIEWTELFTDDGEYLVPSTIDPQGKPTESLFLIYDDHTRLVQRGVRMLKRTNHAEYPHSRTTRMISNVRVSEGEEGMDRIECTFVVYRSRADKLDVYPGRAIYDVVRIDGAIRIRRKKAILGLDELRPQGKVSFIL